MIHQENKWDFLHLLFLLRLALSSSPLFWKAILCLSFWSWQPLHWWRIWGKHTQKFLQSTWLPWQHDNTITHCNVVPQPSLWRQCEYSCSYLLFLCHSYSYNIKVQSVGLLNSPLSLISAQWILDLYFFNNNSGGFVLKSVMPRFTTIFAVVKWCIF